MAYTGVDRAVFGRDIAASANMGIPKENLGAIALL